MRARSPGRRSIVVHGHFYQPPRDDPWTGRVPRQASAAPWHDWNARVHDESYRAVVAARVLEGGRIAHVINTLEWISWDAGPTLLEWMAAEAPDTYRAFLEADALSRERTGHGNALATPYHHVILPLSSRREKVTEVRWGIADFRRRFGREPEGMWLPEAAVDLETLEVLAEEGIRFTVLGPGQVRSIPRGGLPGRVRLPGGRSMAVFVYDGPLSHDVAFGRLLRDSNDWVQRLAATPGELVAMATDGETFGHHHRWGDMALAAMLMVTGRRRDFRLENFASFLARRPPEEDVEVVEPSSWSCAHGVERWRADCGCKIDPAAPTSQAWRATLREVVDELTRVLNAHFLEEGRELFRDPGSARDEYVHVRGASEAERVALVRSHQAVPLDDAGVARALELLEMERDVLRMHTSCAWFFDDVARLEPVQNLMYAAHALDLAGPGAEVVESWLVERLEEAVSNDPSEGTAADIWRARVRDGRAAREEEPVPLAASTASMRAVARALEDPSPVAVEQALAAIDASPDQDLFDAQTVLARGAARRGGLGGAALALAERLGVAPDAGGGGLVRGGPLRFVLALHLHQPVGNFDHVFRAHVEGVYAPLLERFAERGFLPLGLHVSGPLLEWLEAEGHRFLDLVGRLVADGGLELLLAGFYEPVLSALPREDRLDQIGRMRHWLARRFGTDARGLWLTERVWEPGLPRDLAEAGVEYAFVDDRAFLLAGRERHELARPWRTEAEGRSITLLPIDERLRHLIPFHGAADLAAHVRREASAGRSLAVFADDGEKLGGWPGTAEWVWEKGWLDAFLDEMEALADEGVLRLTSPSQAVSGLPAAGPVFLPAASYREMEGWALPPRSATALERARGSLAHDADADTVLRGGHWKSFLGRYEEAHRMHEKALRLSELCRQAGDPEGARRAVARAQCNDAYWHGVFGGLYLKHLRDAVWASLAEAEGVLRAGHALAVEHAADAAGTVRVHSALFAASVEAARGARLVELTHFGARVNLANVLTRRRESYHRTVAPAEAPSDELHRHGSDGDDGDEVHEGDAAGEGSVPSIHEIEERLSLRALPPVDLDCRALLLDRVLDEELDERAYRLADYLPIHSWSTERFEVEGVDEAGEVRLRLRAGGLHRLEKTLTFRESGHVEVDYRWDPAAFPPRARFAPELSLAADPGLAFEPEPEDVWRHDIVTVSKSEAGFEETPQGVSVTPLWPCGLGRARVVIPPPEGAAWGAMTGPAASVEPTRRRSRGG